MIDKEWWREPDRVGGGIQCSQVQEKQGHRAWYQGTQPKTWTRLVLYVHVSVGRWDLPEAAIEDNGAAGLESGPAGDGSDVAACQPNGLRQGQTAYAGCKCDKWCLSTVCWQTGNFIFKRLAKWKEIPAMIFNQNMLCNVEDFQKI